MMMFAIRKHSKDWPKSKIKGEVIMLVTAILIAWLTGNGGN